MEIVPFQKEHIPEAAALFIQNFKTLRQTVPVLPDTMEKLDCVAQKLDHLLAAGPVFAALDQGQVVGYLGGFLVDNFRETGRKGAYCPEWGHAAQDAEDRIYRVLYRAAAAIWTDAGCQVHAITLLAHDRAAEKAWFWSGFGLLVVDAIRALAPVGTPCPAGFSLRKATGADVETLVRLDAEHWQHYTQPPTLMIAQEPGDAKAITRFLSEPHNSIWLAMQGDQPAGFIRFEASYFDTVSIVEAKTAVAITGAYVRPAYRGQRIAPALLDAAFQDYAGQGFDRCSVDFESTNPEAAAFWMRYFEPVCLSVMRVPERNKFS